MKKDRFYRYLSYVILVTYVAFLGALSSPLPSRDIYDGLGGLAETSLDFLRKKSSRNIPAQLNWHHSAPRKATWLTKVKYKKVTDVATFIRKSFIWYYVFDKRLRKLRVNIMISYALTCRPNLKKQKRPLNILPEAIFL